VLVFGVIGVVVCDDAVVVVICVEYVVVDVTYVVVCVGCCVGIWRL